jgi:hypothetical protein
MSLLKIGDLLPKFELDAMVSVKAGDEFTRIHKAILREVARGVLLAN